MVYSVVWLRKTIPKYDSQNSSNWEGKSLLEFLPSLYRFFFIDPYNGWIYFDMLAMSNCFHFFDKGVGPFWNNTFVSGMGKLKWKLLFPCIFSISFILYTYNPQLPFLRTQHLEIVINLPNITNTPTLKIIRRLNLENIFIPHEKLKSFLEQRISTFLNNISIFESTYILYK